MPQGLKLSRLWLAVVLVAFCLPLFVGLGNDDLETDEAGYSYAVDRILETGDWLVPKLSPTENEPFLEKPPLKIWIVALPIRLGLLPHNEFGLRFWDAVLGSASFVYVFALGSLLAGPVCGVVAVLSLFVYWPLVFAHGLRTNNMEAALVLCYAGGTFHFLRWAALDEPSRRARHLVALALLFSLGFMTKFVAALFLPFTLAIAAVLSPRCRRLLVKDWKLWSGATMLVAVLCAPWFVAMHVRFGRGFWQTIFGQHVLQRLTGTLVAEHLQPWHYYITEMVREFGNGGVIWFVYLGLATLLVQSMRRRWLDGFVVLLWAVIPLVIISAGTSKLYHYVFPFLPPIALAAGYVVALVMQLAP
ncbi:MAG: glycosyltransferase family 39 protein, partial [Vicinamibacterales bacterium]